MKLHRKKTGVVLEKKGTYLGLTEAQASQTLDLLAAYLEECAGKAGVSPEEVRHSEGTAVEPMSQIGGLS